MRTTAIQLSLVFGIVASIGRILAEDAITTALISGVATGCSVLLVLFLGDWVVDRISRIMDRRSRTFSKTVDPTLERDEGASDSALAA